MGNFDNSPLSAILGGIFSGWGLVLGPLAALMVGVSLAFLAAGVFEFRFGWIMAVALVVLPIFAWTSAYAFLIGLGMLAAFLRFFLSEEYRLESLLALCCLTALQAFLFLWDFTSRSFGILDWLRILAAFAVLPAIYFSARLYALRQLQALERQIEEDRLERKRQEKQGAVR